MQHFRKIWDDEKNAFVKQTKGMMPGDAYAAFLERYPGIDVTRTAFCNQRSRLGAAGVCRNPHFSRTPRPLYSEQIKKGYVRIKIAQPNVWVSKAKWVYMQTHPSEDLSERSNYIFLDGNNRNFSPENIERVPLALMGLFNGCGGSVPGAPELTRLNLLRAKLKKAQLDALEKYGQIGVYGHCRKDKKEMAKRRREYCKAHPEKCKQTQREYRERRKQEGK